MTDSNDPLSGLPEVLRQSNRPIIIYQGNPAPPPLVDTRTTNALWLLTWLGLVTLCLGIAGLSAWAMWNPTFDKERFSPIYAEGHPRGLIKQTQERDQLNDLADGLLDIRDTLRLNNERGRFVSVTHPLIVNRQGADQGIDELRRRWDAMCQDIRARIYERRFSEIDVSVGQLRYERTLASDPAELKRIDDALQALRLQRNDIAVRRRTDSDPALRCTPAIQANVCLDSDTNPWCNPRLGRPEEFVDGGP